MIWYLISLLTVLGTGIAIGIWITMGSSSVVSGFSDRL